MSSNYYKYEPIFSDIDPSNLVSSKNKPCLINIQTVPSVTSQPTYEPVQPTYAPVPPTPTMIQQQAQSMSQRAQSMIQQIPIPPYQPPTPSTPYQQPSTPYQQPITNILYQPSTSYQQPITNMPYQQQPTPSMPYQQPIMSQQPTYSSTPLTNNQQDQFVQGHTTYRNNVIPAANNMRNISWSNDLENSASNWAGKCTWQHSGTKGLGENLYATSKRVPDPSKYNAMDAVNSWGNEEQYYNYNDNKCEPGQVCGHYTQMVWANSDSLGCHVQDCPSISGLPWPNGGTLVVCQYSPPGNYVGQKPYNTN